MKWGIHWATHGHEEEEESKRRRRRRGVVSCGATFGCSRLGGNVRNDGRGRHLIGERDIAMGDTKTGMKDGRKEGRRGSSATGRRIQG